MTATIDSLIDEYTNRYVARDADGVAELCLCPFLAIREGMPIRLPDRDDIRDHFAAVIDAYGAAGYASFVPVTIDTRQLGERAAFATVGWHALDNDGNVARESLTSYHLLMTPDGWRFLSYTNHF